MSAMASIVATASGPRLDPRIVELSGETLVELLDRAVARTPSSIALAIRRGMADERWTYRDLVERSTRVAQTLRDAGVEQGDRVVTWCPNDPWLVAAYFATWRLGAVIVPLDLRMQTDVAVRIGTRTRPTILLAGQGVDPAAAAALGVPVISVDEAGLAPAAGRRQPAEDGAVAVRSADIAEILFTSGTTSDPKGVVLTHGQIVHTARAIAQTGMGSRSDRALSIVPLSHMYGQTVPLLMGFMGGSTLVFLHALTPKAISSTMQRERITAVALLPQLISILLQGIESEARRRGREASLARGRRLARVLPFGCRRLLFRSVLDPLGGALEVITSGGALLSEELQMAWEAMGVRVVQGYGTTECAAICGHTRASRQVGTVGPPLAGLEIAIAADAELMVRGPNVMRGYWEAPDATAEVLDAEGWFHTGDAARIDASGEVVILGRTRDRIALPNGLKVYPGDVELALRDTGVVRDAVVLEPAPGMLAAVLVPLDAAAADAVLADAVRRANATLAPHQKLGAWKRWPEEDLPRTHTLKVRREPVKAWYVEDMTTRSDDVAGSAARPGPARAAAAPSRGTTAVTLDHLAALIAAAVAETRGGEPPAITAQTELAALELDSLAAVTLALRIEESFEAPLSDDEVLGAADVKALHALVVLRQGQPPPAPPSRWAFSRPARLLRRLLDATIIGWAVTIVARPSVEGAEHLESLDGPVLICPNHASHLDAPLVRAALPPRLRDRTAIAAAADVWFDGSPVGPMTELALGAIPFGRSSDVRASLERVGELVNDGYSVVIFPEGTRSADGRMVPLREGIGLLATSLRVPVVPVHIAGAHQILPKGAWLPRRRGGAGVRVRFGTPLDVDPAAGVHAATAHIGRAIERLAIHA
jgi:long-chain acyl-CoA synthetase